MSNDEAIEIFENMIKCNESFKVNACKDRKCVECEYKEPNNDKCVSAYKCAINALNFPDITKLVNEAIRDVIRELPDEDNGRFNCHSYILGVSALADELTERGK